MIPHYKWLAYFRWPLAFATVAPLVFVLLPFVPESIVTPRNGARRWINLGIMDVQPSEVAKVMYVAIMAGYLRYRDTYRRFSGLFVPALIAFVPMSLILVEPDLGTSLLFIPALVAMLIAAGAKLWHLITTGALAGVFAVVVIAVSLVAAERGEYPILREHQVERIQTVVGPYLGLDADVQGRDYQSTRAKTLIGAGGLSGHPENKAAAFVHFSRLPERHNDMIFPVIVARWGFMGALGVISLYVLWITGGADRRGLVQGRLRADPGRGPGGDGGDAGVHQYRDDPGPAPDHGDDAPVRQRGGIEPAGGIRDGRADHERRDATPALPLAFLI